MGNWELGNGELGIGELGNWELGIFFPSLTLPFSHSPRLPLSLSQYLFISLDAIAKILDS